MKFIHSTLKVNNLDESINFYTDIVGLKVASRFKTGNGMEIAFLGVKFFSVKDPNGMRIQFVENVG